MEAWHLVVGLVLLALALFWAIPAVMVWPEPAHPLLFVRRLRCAMRQQHDPVRHRMGRGGFRCLACGFIGADLEEMGYKGGGYVAPMRRSYEHGRGAGVERSRREEMM